ncbi:MAG TPA: alpha/beta hydrolase-fold protein [Bryobacteraceae bacterium]|nr:alpha/beta hydrolase-fold protein [Bryobacteraceae bacterium]
MRRFAILTLATLPLVFLAAQQPPGGRGSQQPPVLPTAEEKAQLQSKVDAIEESVRKARAKHAGDDVVADVEVYARAGRWLLEYPTTFYTQDGINNALTVLDSGVERARQLQDGQSPWVAQKGRKIHGFYSALDGSIQPYGLIVPESYDGMHPVRLYVWLHGRNNTLTEASFISGFLRTPAPQNLANSADLGQIQLEVYSRGNNANHWAGEVDTFEAIADVQKRYKIDPDRVILRGFSLGGAGAWHLALHHPDRFAAAEIGAGTWPRRYTMSGFPPYQAATLRIWENMTQWALNAYNLPIAGHDGDNDPQVASIPRPEPGAPTRGQLESSIRVREQLAKEGFPSEGEPNFLRAKGTTSIFMISENTGHSASPVVKQHLEAFVKEWGDRGRVSPDHIRFLTYTTRYNRDYWVTVDGLGKHYERADIDAVRSNGGERYQITTHNIARLTLRETGHAAEMNIDGQDLKLKSSPEITLEKAGPTWRVASGKWAGLHKTHALQGPIDDAFLDPFLLVRPTGAAWNEGANRKAIERLEQFERVYARNYRAHVRVKDDKDVTDADFAKYNVALFGDPGSNRWIAKVQGKLPLRWTRENVSFGEQSFAAADSMPVMIYPNPLNRARYIVINSGLTIEEREYNSDYSMPQLGDFAVLKVKGGGVPEVAYAGLFDESWQLPK